MTGHLSYAAGPDQPELLEATLGDVLRQAAETAPDRLAVEYFENPDETAKAIDEEGWLHTGDLCSMDAIFDEGPQPDAAVGHPTFRIILVHIKCQRNLHMCGSVVLALGQVIERMDYPQSGIIHAVVKLEVVSTSS